MYEGKGIWRAKCMYEELIKCMSGKVYKSTCMKGKVYDKLSTCMKGKVYDGISTHICMVSYKKG